jgi:hypothetical protein
MRLSWHSVAPPFGEQFVALSVRSKREANMPLLVYLPFVVWMGMAKLVQDELCPVFWLNRPAHDIDNGIDYDPNFAVISLGRTEARLPERSAQLLHRSAVE